MMQRIASSLKRVITRSKEPDLKTATGMAEWASNPNGTLTEICARASQFGDFLIHHTDREEAKAALTKFAESICRTSHLSRWLCRDVLFSTSRHFLEPDFESLAEEILNDYSDGEELYEQVTAYHTADPETRAAMRAEIEPEILALLDDFDERVRYYRQNEVYISELRKLEEAITCDKYGI